MNIDIYTSCQIKLVSIDIFTSHYYEKNILQKLNSTLSLSSFIGLSWLMYAITVRYITYQINTVIKKYSMWHSHSLATQILFAYQVLYKSWIVLLVH